MDDVYRDLSELPSFMLRVIYIYRMFGIVLPVERHGPSMFCTLRKSLFDVEIFEIVEGDLVVKEIVVRFHMRKWPSTFSSPMAIEQWVEKEERRLAKEYAYRLLSIRGYASGALQKKLQQKCFSLFVCREVIENCRALGYLDDENLTLRLIEKEMERGYGPLYIEKKLRLQGLKTTHLRKIITVEWQLKAIQKLLTKLRCPASALQRRGFDPSLIFKSLRGLGNEEME